MTNRIKELNEQRGAISAEMKALTTAALERSDKSLSAEEQEKYNELRAKRDAIDCDIAVFQDQEAEDMRYAQNKAAEKRGSDQTSIEERAFFAAFRGESLNAEERAALTMDNSQIVIPNSIQRDIVLGVQGTFGILSHIDLQLTDNAGTMTFPYLVGPLTLQKVAIGGGETNGTVTPKGVQLSAFDFKLPTIPISETLLRASDADLRAAIVNMFTEYITRGLSDKIINSGDDNKDFKAFLPQIKTAAAASADAITYADVVNTKAKVKAPYNAIGRASWLMNSSTKDALLGLVDKQGRPLYIESMSAGVPDKLFGYPVVIDDAMPEIATGNRVLVFGDLKAYKARIVSGVRVKVYDESKYAEQGCIGMQAFVTADGRLLYEDGAIEPLAALEMA